MLLKAYSINLSGDTLFSVLFYDETILKKIVHKNTLKIKFANFIYIKC